MKTIKELNYYNSNNIYNSFCERFNCLHGCSCGSGLSGECLTEQGHYWVGVDISPHMLGISFTRHTGNNNDNTFNKKTLSI